MKLIPVYKWLLSDGSEAGCGTRAEFDYWNAEGVNPEGMVLGDVICYEPASEDERRKVAWGVSQ